jgi:serine/threonine-protein kinase
MRRLTGKGGMSMAFGSSSALPGGTRLNGIYEIDEPLATGGMGEIYSGHAIQTGDKVAIKLIRAELAEDEAALALFRREASALHSIHHEAIVRYFVFSIDPTLQRPYLAMEFVEGEPLSDILRDGRLALTDVLALKTRVASGLHAAHLAGIVHRDIAPDNILVKNHDFSSARIIDFGIARSTKPGEATVIGSGFAGKFNYVSPEQLGLFNGEVTARSDIYSFGLVLAFACLGKRIDMGGSQVEVIEKRRAVPDLQGVYPEMRPLLARMLDPDPSLRPQTMLEVANWTPRAKAAPDERTIIKLPPVAQGAVKLGASSAPQLAISGGGDSLWPNKGRAIGGGALLLAIAAAGLVYHFARTGPAPKPVVATVPETEKHDEAAAPIPPPPPAGQQFAGAASADEIRDFIAHYPSGDCTFLAPVKVTDAGAQVDGVGVDDKAFVAFDKAFKTVTRVEAEIAVRAIAPAQCPAVDFLTRTGGRAADGPKLSLRKASIRSGDVLTGDIASDQPHLELVIVDDDGRVYNVTSRMRGGGANRVFAMRLQKAAAARAHPMLLLAIASPTPLTSLAIKEPMEAKAFFAAATSELESLTGVKATMAYFQIE